MLVLAALPASAAADLRGLGRDLGQAARAAGLRRVAVARLEPLRGQDDGEGAALSERLIAALVRAGRVQAVERVHLAKLMEEHSLGRSGALDAAAGRRLGRLAPVDAVITGSYELRGRRLRVVARVVELETGIIVGAADQELERDEDAGGLIGDPFFVPVPVLRGNFPPFDEGLRDAPSGGADNCAGAAERVNALEGHILELKARYWAQRLRSGLSGAELTVNPGSTIPDPGLRERFYERLRHWHSAEELRPLSPDEVKRFARLNGQAYSLYRECRL